MNPPPWLSDPWWRWFLTIALASVVAGLIFFIANWFLTKRNRREDQADRRISAVADAFVRVSTTHPIQYQGIQALLLAGVKGLQDNEEIHRALQRIVERTGRHPLGEDGERLDRGSLMAFFKEVQINLVNYKQALEKYRAKTAS